jgi:NADH-quinone oxidoreductase subunit L
LLLFVGACGKSAQIPLFVWLPDAMAGPTPVSALIHAATMVTAGVYVTCRMGALYLAAPAAMMTVAIVGAITALVAAVIGIGQDDIKKVLAYSTVSQLGYMMLAAGVGAYTAAIFHLMTHAFFKALLFLAMSGEQNIRRMGGLRGGLPVTHLTFAVAVMAIAGLPPFAGFFSKDEILWSALTGAGGSIALWSLGVITAGITAFYMTRLYVLVFSGTTRASEEARAHLHESPASMTGPLVVLAIGAVLVGFLGVPHFLGGERLPNLFDEFLAPVMHLAGGASAAHHGAATGIGEWAAMLTALVISVIGIALAWVLYGRGPTEAAARSAMVRLVKGKFFFDELIDRVLLQPYRWACRVSAAFDDKVVDGLVNATGLSADLAGQIVRLVQTGYVRNYAFMFLLGTVLILFFWVFR